MTTQAIVAGGGIGGLAAALALARTGAKVRLLERSTELAEVGAGIQLGPNVTRRLLSWGLQSALDGVVAYPDRLTARNAVTGATVGELPLGRDALDKYGAPYVAVHRADMQQLLLRVVEQSTDARLTLNTYVSGFTQRGAQVDVKTADGLTLSTDLLVGADGLWSRVRQTLLGDEGPRVTGHLAYRAMVPQSSLPQSLRSQVVTAWMGPRLHVVQYPVRRGEWLNVVAIVEGQMGREKLQGWDHEGQTSELRSALRQADAAPALQDLVAAIESWRLWSLCDRPPMRSAQQQAQGRVALLGDAAHPMRPYLAQGAGMAIEDAAELEQQMRQSGGDVPRALHGYAQARWRRNARVQSRAIRNGNIYHSQGVVRWGRDRVLSLLGRHVMDVPWLYRY